MPDARRRKALGTSRKAHEARPRHTSTLAAPQQPMPPAAPRFRTELGKPAHVARHGVVVEVPVHDPPQPRTDHGDRFVSPPVQHCPQPLERGSHPLARRPAQHREASAFPGHATDVRKAKKVERLRSTQAAAAPTGGRRHEAELQHPRLGFVEGFGIGLPLAAICRRPSAGWTSRKVMAARGRWAFPGSRTAIAQTVVKGRLEPLLERHFHDDSYGYRPGRSAHQALVTARRRCWQRDWVLDLDIKTFFDTIDWTLFMRALRWQTDCNWVLLYV